MGRPGLEGIEEKILEATIQVAGNSPLGSFSTKEIAERCGVSEFTVFDHFKSKERLIEAASDVLNRRYFTMETECAKIPDPYLFFSALLDRLLDHPEAVRFALNYSLLFPRIGQGKNYHHFMEETEHYWKEVTPLTPLKELSLQEWYGLISFATREILQDAFYIQSGEIEDTPKTRRLLADLVFKGLAAFSRPSGK